MKRNYIIPTTESMAFHAGSICDGSAGTGMTITGNSEIQMGGNKDSLDPM